MNKFTFFWNKKSPLTNWWMEDFNAHRITFNCSEQYMMYRKAELFNDQKAMRDILQASSPREQKNLGRLVKNYIESEWAAKRERIVTEGLMFKFHQSVIGKKVLLDSIGTTIAEASPYDLVWGIGLSEDDVRAQHPDQWPGQNLLGKSLTTVRSLLSNSIDSYYTI